MKKRKPSFDELFARAIGASKQGTQNSNGKSRVLYKGVHGVQIEPRNKPQHIEILGTRWRDTFGNTYHKAYVYVDGKEVAKVGPYYGYGEHYVESGYEWLEDKGYVPKRLHKHGTKRAPWAHARELDIKFDYSAKNVRRKKDL